MKKSFLKLTSIFLANTLLPISAFAAIQNIDVSIETGSFIFFKDNISFVTADFQKTGNTLRAEQTSEWSYLNNEENRRSLYKITGQISNITAASKPSGWTISSDLGTIGSGTSSGMTTLPWSDEPPVTFYTSLPQLRNGQGTQTVQIDVADIADLTTQSIDITWTIAAE